MPHLIKMTIISLLALIALSACSLFSSSSTHSEQDYLSEHTAVPFSVLAQDNFSGIYTDSPRIYSIRDDAAWEQFWQAHDTLGLAAPDVDFSDTMVIAIIDQTQPSSGYTLEVNDIISVQNTLYVRVNRNEPGADCFNASVITQPFTIVELNQDNREAELSITSTSVPC